MHSSSTPPARRISIPTKIAYGFGSIAYGIKDNGFSTLLLLFYNQVVGLKPELVGLAVMIALVLDAFIDPLVGQLSDRTRSRWGRRHPFMYAAAIPVGVLYLLLWNPPTGSQAGTLIYLVVVAILVRTAISCYEVPSSALAPELTSDYDERTSVLGYRYLFSWVGGMGMVLVTFTVFLAPTAAFPIGQLNPAGYRSYAIAASAIMVGAILLSAIGTHNQIRHLPTTSDREMTFRETMRGIAAALSNRAFLILMLAGVFSFAAQGLNFALTTYFYTFLWQFPSYALALFTVAVILGAIIAFSIAPAISRWVGKRRTAVGATLCVILTGTGPLMLRHFGLFPANDSPMLLPILLSTTVLGVAFSVAGSILTASMMSDVVEDAQVRTGERSEGLFFAGSFFMQKCVSGLGVFVSGAVLAAAGFPAAAKPGAVAPAVLDHLLLIYCGSFAALCAVSAIAVSRFPLGRADHERRLAELAEAASHVAPLPGSESEASLVPQR